MQQFELDYATLVQYVLIHGEERQTRNGETKSIFSYVIDVPMENSSSFPIIQGRKMYHKGVFGELAAMLRKPTCIADFEAWGCNYWKDWAKEDGSIAIDYGNAWHADGQIEHLKHSLKHNPTDRRMIIDGWRPGNLAKLDLPCCHLLYQFYVRDGIYLDMMWYQRSADVMIGIPSDIIFAAAWLIAIAHEFSYIPGNISMVFGDCHIYKEHYKAAKRYVENVTYERIYCRPHYTLISPEGKDFCEFEPKDLIINDYISHPKLNLELKT